MLSAMWRSHDAAPRTEASATGGNGNLSCHLCGWKSIAGPLSAEAVFILRRQSWKPPVGLGNQLDIGKESKASQTTFPTYAFTPHPKTVTLRSSASLCRATHNVAWALGLLKGACSRRSINLPQI